MELNLIIVNNTHIWSLGIIFSKYLLICNTYDHADLSSANKTFEGGHKSSKDEWGKASSEKICQLKHAELPDVGRTQLKVDFD